MNKLLLSLILASSALASSAWAKDVVPEKTTDILVSNHDVPVTLAERIKDALQSAIPGTKLPTPLVLAIMKIESGFDPSAKGGGGAAGLMQVMPNIHLGRVRDISDKPNLSVRGAQKELLNVETNVEAGVAILAECYKRHNGNAGKAAECYNGYTNPTVHAYRAKVMKAYNEISASFGSTPR